MADFMMCASTNCPVASNCKRSEASGTRSSERKQSWTIYHWRRHRISDRVICNGFSASQGNGEVSHG